MKNLVKKIDQIFFGGLFIKIYSRSSYSKKKIRSFHKNYLIKIDNLRQYNSLTYWNNHFNHLSANDVEGDIVECGVGNGQTLSYILFNLSGNKKTSCNIDKKCSTFLKYLTQSPLIERSHSYKLILSLI